jgi:hypothetical protein
LSDVFSEGDEYKTVIAEFAAKDINRRADEMERQEARRNNRQPEKRDEPVMTADGLPEMDTWGVSDKGFVAYFDFPHVMAVFDKTVVPRGVLARFLKPDGIVPLVSECTVWAFVFQKNNGPRTNFVSCLICALGPS